MFGNIGNNRTQDSDPQAYFERLIIPAASRNQKPDAFDSYEISLIGISAGIFAVAFFVGSLWTKGGFSWTDFGWLAVAFLLHDAYFYWCHRLLHHRKFWRFHRVHHTKLPVQSLHSLKVSAVEATIEALFLPVLTWLWQPNFWVFAVFGMGMMVTNWWGHSGKIFGFTPRWNLRWLNRPADHELHHDLPSHNLSAYFPLWDYICGTRWDAGIERFEVNADHAVDQSAVSKRSGAV